MKIEDYNLADVKCLDIELENGDFKYIPLIDFVNWLTDNGHMESFHVTSDHNGKPVEHEIKFADFEEWSLDKTNLDVIKYIQDYLNEKK